ncbi:MAG: DUF5678 domain-containing protein [Acidobacteriota bacterium]
MSGSTIEDILREIAQLPQSEQNRLRHLLDQREDQTASRDRAVSLAPVPDSTRELQWVIAHARQYAGQWVALDGDRLIAHAPVASEVFDAADADGAHLPLITFVEHPEKVYAGF